ncbi:MAG: hypothetical protein ACWGQW_01790 [bacterium]
MKVMSSEIVTAFSDQTIGTKVTDPKKFWAIVLKELAAHDKGSDREPGQHFIMLSGTPSEFLSSGVGRRTANPDDYVLRLHRGQVKAYLRREFAAPLEGAAVVIYTIEAYANDPQVDHNELAKLQEAGCTHVLVAVLGFAGPKAPLTPGRFVQNLAGGNNEALRYSADEIRSMAREIANYWSSEDGGEGWCTVAD